MSETDKYFIKTAKIFKLKEDEVSKDFKEDKLGIDWINEKAKQRVYTMINELGFGDPNCIDTNPGGCAIWLDMDPFYDEIIIYDFPRYNVHHEPATHGDFFFVKVKMQNNDVADEKLKKISEALYYEPSLKRLIAGCHFLGAGLVSIRIGQMILQNKIKAEYAKSMYNTLIMKASKEAMNAHKLYVKTGKIQKTPFLDSIEKDIKDNLTIKDKGLTMNFYKTLLKKIDMEEEEDDDDIISQFKISLMSTAKKLSKKDDQEIASLINEFKK